MRRIEIEWHPRMSVTTNEEDWEYSLDGIPSACLNRSCFYCIYGRHPVYGPDVLLYIGETKKSEGNARDVSKRLREHFGGRFWNHTDLSISIGVPVKELEADVMQAAEAILIASHAPAFNRRHIDGAPASAKNYLIQNFGFIRSLITECSGSYWSK